MRPKPTGRPLDQRLQKLLKKKKKDKIKDKVKEKLKQKKKTKSTKTGLLSKAGLMPVSTPGGIPKVMSQKTAQKDPPPSKRRPIPGKPPKDRMPPELLRPKMPPRKFIPMAPEVKRKLKDKGVMAFAPGGTVAKMIKTSGRIDDKDKARANKSIMDLARKLKPTGRLSTTDLARARAAFKMARKGQKPVLDSKGKPVKNLTQKAGPGKPMSADQKKQLRKFKNVFKGKMPKRQKPGMKSLMGVAGKGMMKGAAGKSMKRKLKRLI